MKQTTLERDLKVLELLKDHVITTHSPDFYYVGKGGFQSRDLIEAAGWLAPQSLANAVDYLFRYGKKDGSRPSDLLKAMHCIAMAYAAEHLGPESDSPATVEVKMNLVRSHDGTVWTPDYGTWAGSPV